MKILNKVKIYGHYFNLIKYKHLSSKSSTRGISIKYQNQIIDVHQYHYYLTFHCRIKYET